VAYVYEFGDYLVASEASGGDGNLSPPSGPPVRNTLTTNRIFASIIYRFSGSWQP
jgi:hypothetical protein